MQHENLHFNVMGSGRAQVRSPLSSSMNLGLDVDLLSARFDTMDKPLENG